MARRGCASPSVSVERLMRRARRSFAKLRDVVGLYVDPPANAIVLSVDEKSQIQALDRTQPGTEIRCDRKR